jgi:hypothetical protein
LLQEDEFCDTTKKWKRKVEEICHSHCLAMMPHQGREIIAIGALENGAFCTVFSENFHKF